MQDEQYDLIDHPYLQKWCHWVFGQYLGFAASPLFDK
jgi:hypothetical protein